MAIYQVDASSCSSQLVLAGTVRWQQPQARRTRRDRYDWPAAVGGADLDELWLRHGLQLVVPLELAIGTPKTAVTRGSRGSRSNRRMVVSVGTPMSSAPPAIGAIARCVERATIAAMHAVCEKPQTANRSMCSRPRPEPTRKPRPVRAARSSGVGWRVPNPAGRVG